MGYKSFDFLCPCGHRFTDLVQDSERDNPQFCPSCEEMTAVRTLSVPNFMSPSIHVGKEEFKRDEKRQRLIEANKLEKQAFNLPREKRGELNKEIKKLKSTTTKGDNK